MMYVVELVGQPDPGHEAITEAVNTLKISDTIEKDTSRTEIPIFFTRLPHC
jgi:hypothetical protein